MEDRPSIGEISSRRIRLSYLERGNPGGPTLLFLHGLNDHNRTFDAVVQPFLDDYRVITPDLRGHGDSGWVQGSGYNQLDYLYDLYRLISDLKLAPLTLIGHSLGGAVVALLTGVFPMMVDRLILLEAMGLWIPEEGDYSIAERLKNWVVQLSLQETRIHRKIPDVDAAYERMHQANPNLTEATARHLAFHGIRKNRDETYSWKYDYYTRGHDFSLSHEELVDIWKQISCPVLVVNAKNGLSHRIGHNDTLKYFDRARLEILDDAGHWIYHDQQIKIQKLIGDFVRQGFD